MEQKADGTGIYLTDRMGSNAATVPLPDEATSLYRSVLDTITGVVMS